MFKTPSPKIYCLILILALLPFVFTADARMQTNQPPVANGDSYTLHGGGVVGPVFANDSDPDGNPLSATIVTYPTKGSLYGIYAGVWSYRLSDNGYVGPDSFTYKACDNQGACSGTVTVNITNVNSTPVAVDDNYTVHGNTDIGPFQANDYDADNDTLSSPTIMTGASHGTVYGTAYPNIKSYRPAYGYVGPDSFTYQVCDPLNKCATATVNINVVNNPPIALMDVYLVRGSTKIGPLLANDFDPDGDSIPVTPTFVTYPQHGTLYGLANPNPADTKNYVPQAGYAGYDSFTYKINDSLGQYSSPALGFLFVLKSDGAENAGATSCNSKIGHGPAPGQAPSSVGEPVNVTNGNMYLQQTDYDLPGAGEAIKVTRTYNSILQSIGLFGRGWSSAYDESIESYDNNLVRLNLPDGRAVYFGRTAGSGAFAPLAPDFRGQVSKNGDGTFTLSLKDGRTHGFSAAGKLLTLTDRNGNQTALAYDAGGKLTSITDPFGRVLTVTANTNGRVVSLSDSVGTVATYTYGTSQELLSATYADNSKYQFAYGYANSKLVLTSVTDALGNVLEAHTYDSQGRALTSEKQGGVERYTLSYVSATETDVTDALARVTKYFFDTSKGRNVVTRIEGTCACGGASNVKTWTYDGMLNVLSETNGLNQTTTFTYDADGNRLTVTDATGTTGLTYNVYGQVLTATDQMQGVTTNTYDASGNLLTTKDALNSTVTRTYDARGQLLTVKDALNNVTTMTWDASGRLSQVEDAAHNTTVYAYDARARLTSATNALNEATAYEYDAAGRLKKVTYPDTSFVQYTYDLGGRRTKVKDARGYETAFAYDAAYRLVSVTNADNKTTGYGYDLMSNLTSKTDALGRTTNYEYDEFGRLVKTIHPPAAAGAARLEARLEYGFAGNVKKRVDMAARETLSEYDPAGRLVKVTDPASQVTRFEYNARSQTTAMIDALNQRYEFAYDARGRVTQITRGSASMSYTYDAAGNRTQRTDYNGATTGYTYDSLNRLTAVAYTDSTGVSYGYDQLSRLTSATNENGTVSYNYDNRGRLAGATGADGVAVSYGYDASGNRTSLSLGQATSATYQYDALDRLTQLADGGGAATTFSYDATDKLTARTLPNGVAGSYQYDGLDRLTRLQQVKGAATVADFQYQYSAAGNITQIADAAGAHVYGYDAADRLTSATHPVQQGESYTYDAVGNRTASHLSPTYGYQPFNQTVTIGSTSYGYDLNGNLTSKTDSSGTWSYAWDYENRLKQVTSPDGTTITYQYDALGRRIRKSDGATWTKYVYDGRDIVRDINSDGSTVEYLNGLGIDDKIRQTSSAGALYFVQDHLGSTRALTDASGEVVESVSYDSFGNGASALTRYGYTGREWDADANLYYYRARWYDPQAGRFISEDPIGLRGGNNFYAYVENNALRYRDPDGLAPWDYVLFLWYSRKCLNEGLECKKYCQLHFDLAPVAWAAAHPQYPGPEEQIFHDCFALLTSCQNMFYYGAKSGVTAWPVGRGPLGGVNTIREELPAEGLLAAPTLK